MLFLAKSLYNIILGQELYDINTRPSAVLEQCTINTTYDTCKYDINTEHDSYSFIK